MNEYQKQWWNEAKNLSLFQNAIYKRHFWFFIGYMSIDIMQAAYWIMTERSLVYEVVGFVSSSFSFAAV